MSKDAVIQLLDDIHSLPMVPTHSVVGRTFRTAYEQLWDGALSATSRDAIACSTLRKTQAVWRAQARRIEDVEAVAVAAAHLADAMHVVEDIAARSATSHVLQLELSRSRAALKHLRDEAMGTFNVQLLAVTHTFARAARTGIGKQAHVQEVDGTPIEVTSTFGGNVIDVPARFSTCQHHQPFDARPMSASATTIDCPVCNLPSQLDDVYEAVDLRDAFAQHPAAGKLYLQPGGAWSTEPHDPTDGPSMKRHRSEV
jgi:hypothetical protein